MGLYGLDFRSGKPSLRLRGGDGQTDGQKLEKIGLEILEIL